MAKQTNASPQKDAAQRPRRGYAGRTAEQLEGERRQRLLDAALELFGGGGYNMAPIELLCRTAGVTARHFYELFDSREALLRAVYDNVISETRKAVMKALLDEAKSPLDRLHRAVAAFVTAYTDDPRRARIACIEVVGVSESMAKRRNQVIHEFATLVEAFVQSLVRARLLPPRNYHLTCVGMVGAVNELMSEWLVVEQRPSIEQLTLELQMLFEAILAGGRAISEKPL